MKNMYLGLAILGGILPFAFFIPYFSAQGPGIGDFLAALFTNGASGGFSVDLLISSIVFWTFIFSEQRVRKPWIFVATNIVIGLSCALPLYLYYRSNKPENSAQ